MFIYLEYTIIGYQLSNRSTTMDAVIPRKALNQKSVTRQIFLDEDDNEFFIALNGGGRSSKNLFIVNRDELLSKYGQDKDGNAVNAESVFDTHSDTILREVKISVIHEIDDSEVVYDSHQFHNSFIGTAIATDAFFSH